MNVEVSAYKHEHAEVVVDLAEGDCDQAAFAFARMVARKALGLDVTPAEVDAAKEILKKARRSGLV